ncbi:hypothetical protein ACLOAV_008250 [Pseudogymnoascus australis]
MLAVARIAVVALAIIGEVAAAGRGNSIYFSGEAPCPVLCDKSGPNPDNWTAYHSVERLDYCNKTLILSFSVFNALDDPNTAATSIRACVFSPSSDVNTVSSSIQQKATARQLRASSQIQSRQSKNSTKLNATLEQQVQAAWKKSFPQSDGADAVTLVGQLKEFLGTVTIEVASSLGPSLFFIRQHDTETSSFVTLPIRLQTTAINSDSDSVLARSLSKRATCTTTTVEAHNLCADLAKKCGITTAQLLQYNPQPNFCTTLKVPQKVCCSAGNLPVPKPDQNGNCATYKVGGGDDCWGITNSLFNLVSIADLEKYNKNTWGWGTCNNLQAGTIICLSSGTPPLPLPVPNAVCGPIKPGTIKPPAGTNLASLNPCPLNACCDLWGYCGTTNEFCRPIPAGQAPGAPQKIGGPNCVSNCGTGIVNNGVPPASFFNIGYFEGYGLSRACDRVDIRTIDMKKYTHIHFAFATVTPDVFDVDMGPTVNQFYYFKQLTGIKKILSFGGWTFSTDPVTYGIFRTGVLGPNRQKMAENIAKFIVNNNLDGVDIDWEYPAAPSLPDIPPGDPTEGENYLQFLMALKNILPKDKTVSFAAPASFWYLKGFPIAKIMKVVDYVIYMTYDLHGQWDYDNKWSNPGCPGGNCLRSHINMTETTNALSLITKAGAASNKVVVGVSSYGRSFKMTTPGCTGSMCTYTGPDSGAAPGKCTQTPGYIANSEIRNILATNPGARSTYDSVSQSDILVYNSTEWVAYMSDDTKKSRQQQYKSLNHLGLNKFLGTTDWAISLDNVGLVAPPPEVIIGPNDSYAWPLDAVDPRLHKSCDLYKDIVLEAWAEAGELTKTPSKWTRWNKYQNAMNDYIGAKSGQFPFIDDHDALPFPGKAPTPRCRYDSTKKSGVAAVTYRYPGRVWSEYHTLLCPLFLSAQPNAPKFHSLKDTAKDADAFPEIRNTIDRWSNSIRAVTIFHETVHWQDISWPTCDRTDSKGNREEYAPEKIVTRSRKGGSDGYEANLRNAHSWTLAATAMWMMERWPNIGVPQPRKPVLATVDESDELPEGQWDDALDIGR